MKRSVKNKLRRVSNTSQKMCTAARLLECLRRMDSSCETMSDFLTPAKFDMVLRTTIELSDGTEESFLNPSTALKYGYDLQEMADIKESVGVITNDKTCRLKRQTSSS